MKNKFLRILWFYPFYSQRRRKGIDQYFEEAKEKSANGDDFYTYASFVIDIVCFRKDPAMTVEEMDALIETYQYPLDFAERLTEEIYKCVAL